MSQLAYPPADDRGDRTNLRELWWGLRRHRWLILGVVAGTVSTAAVWVVLSAPLYESEATLRIATEDRESSVLSSLPSFAELALPGLGASDEVETEIGVLGSRRIAEAVVDSLGLRVQLLAPKQPRDSYLRVVESAPGNAEGTFTFRRERDGGYRLVEHEMERPGPLPERVRVGEPFRLGEMTLALSPGVHEPTPERIRIALLSSYDAVEEFRKQLHVAKQEGRSRLVEITFRSRDPALAAAAVNGVAERFLEYKQRTGKGEIRTRVEVLRDQTNDYARQLRELEERLRRYRERHRILNPQEEAIQEVRILADVRATRETARIEREAMQRLLREVQEQDRSRDGISPYRRLATFPSFLTNQGVQSLLESLNTLEDERSELLLLRTAKNAEVQRVEGRIAELEQQLYRLAANYVQSLDHQIASADASLDRFGAELAVVPTLELEYARLLREQNLLGEVYLNLQARLKEAEIQDALDPEEVRVIDYGLVPEEPVSPRPAVTLILAAVLGLMVGVVIAVGRDALDTKVRSQLDAEEATGGLPVLGAIPHVGVMGNGRDRRLFGRRWRYRPPGPGAPHGAGGPWLMTRHESRHSAAEAFRSLRTSIASAGAGSGPNVVVITSALPGDGKSLSATNLAIALTQQGDRVLLMDGDLRRGTLHRVLGGNRQPGLSQLLQGETSLPDAIQSIDLGGGAILDFLAAGPSPSHPAELLGSERMQETIAVLRGRYDRIVVDAPALHLLADAAVLGTLADAAILVVRAGSTDRAALQQAATRLDRLRIPICGVILNDIEMDALGTPEAESAGRNGRGA